MKKAAATILLCLVVGACSPYTEKGLLGGVSANRISGDTYAVSARGNNFTKAERVRDFVLMKSAELTKANGASYFRILSVKDTTISYSYMDKEERCISSPAMGMCSMVDVERDVIKPGLDAVIQVLTVRSNKLTSKGMFSADEVIQKLSANLKPFASGNNQITRLRMSDVLKQLSENDPSALTPGKF